MLPRAADLQELRLATWRAEDDVASQAGRFEAQQLTGLTIG